MESRKYLQKLIENFELDNILGFFRSTHDNFSPSNEDCSHYLDSESGNFSDLKKLGEIDFDDSMRLIVVSSRVKNGLTSRSGKKKQYEIGRKVLKEELYDAGIFIFYDDSGNFRFSLIVAQYFGSRRTFTNFRRYTYFVSPHLPNKTFLNQVGMADFSGIEKLLSAFSIEAVSEEFYNDFIKVFESLSSSVKGRADTETKRDFSLLFVMRTIFIIFVQKKGWLGENDNFLRDFWNEYREQFDGNNRFYTEWLEPLFFEALNSPPGRKVKYNNNDFSAETSKLLQSAPFLNGELFKEKNGIDDCGLLIPDTEIEKFIEFIFQYNITIEENTLYDEELELNPEFLGIIFERLIAKANGAVYTPRVEVDFMCRLALVKWLEKKNLFKKEDLYYLFFRESGIGSQFDEKQMQGDFTAEEIRALINLLENIVLCDPAAGSGAFEVGMLHVLDEILDNLYSRNNAPKDIAEKTPFERKKEIIAKSLYGVEVKHWAVWINHLRLWLTLFIDMPDDYKNSIEPLLPSLNFKVRSGDSLVQRIGSKTFPVSGHADLPIEIKRKITKLKNMKNDFFHNCGKSNEFIRQYENIIFLDILNAEIKEKKRKLAGDESVISEQVDMHFLEGKTEYELKKQNASEDEEKQLKKEIEELETQKQNLRDEHPLIWSIEFAEIFFDCGGFDIIIGNPPYVRQESIADPTGNLSPKEYKEALQQMVKMDFPNHFKGKTKINGKSDLYTFFYIRSLHLLNSQGVHVFICSNSWLDVGYGIWMQEFLLRNVPMHFIIDNHAKRSFKSSDINTVISVFGAPYSKAKFNSRKNDVRDDSRAILKFVAFKKPFEEVVLTENLLQIECAVKVAKNDKFRVFPVTVQKLLEEGMEFDGENKKHLGGGKYIGDKWGGKYLRAPDIFFTILEKGKDKFVKLKDVAEVRFGIKTGCNEFFYLTDEEVAKWGIEEEFLRPVIKSPRECKSILIKQEDLKYKVFMCHKSREELKRTNALRYIEWGEQAEIVIKQGKDKGKKIKGFHKLESVKNRQRWWDLGQWKPSIGILPCGFGETFRFFLNKDAVFADKRMYLFFGKKRTLNFMNCTIYPLFLELGSRVGLGDGLLDLTVYEFKASFIMKSELALKEYNRQINSIFIECGIDPKSKIPISKQEPKPLPDRAELDNIVFDALNLTEEERKEVYRAVCQLVWNRISKAKSV